MKVASIIIFVILAIFVTWLVVDTILYTIKRVKVKKLKKQSEKNIIDNDVNKSS